MSQIPVELTEELPEGYVALEIVAVIKCLDAEGEPTIAVRTSGGLMAWECVGMLIAACDSAREDIKQDFKSLRRDDDNDD